MAASSVALCPYTYPLKVQGHKSIKKTKET